MAAGQSDSAQGRRVSRLILRVGMMAGRRVRRTESGTPKAGSSGPVLCDVYLHRTDRAWDVADGALVRYADDAVVVCWSRSQPERALARLVELMTGLGLDPKTAKTRIVHLRVGGEGLDFPGFYHRLVRSPA